MTPTQWHRCGICGLGWPSPVPDSHCPQCWPGTYAEQERAEYKAIIRRNMVQARLALPQPPPPPRIYGNPMRPGAQPPPPEIVVKAIVNFEDAERVLKDDRYWDEVRVAAGLRPRREPVNPVLWVPAMMGVLLLLYIFATLLTMFG